MTEQLVGQLGYVGIALILVLGGLGLPVPEEAPIILAAVLSRGGKMWWPLALGSCLTGVLVGDFIVYFLGYFYGEKVLSLPLTRKFLTRAREAQIKGYFHRHGVKILILGRFAVGFRTAAYLTAGILKLPALKLFLADLFAASLSTFLMFGLGYAFADQIHSNFDRVKHWSMAAVAVGLVSWLLHRYYRARQRAGLPVGPPVLETDDVPLPPDDLHSLSGEFRAVIHPPPPAPMPVPPTPPEPVTAPAAAVDIPAEPMPAAATAPAAPVPDRPRDRPKAAPTESGKGSPSPWNPDPVTTSRRSPSPLAGEGGVRGPGTVPAPEDPSPLPLPQGERAIARPDHPR